MNLNIISIENRGVKNQERISFKALDNLDLSRYMVLLTRYLEVGNKVENGIKIAYWFPPYKVKAGDFVRLNTSSGSYKTFTNVSETNTHELYMDFDEPFLTNPKDCVMLFELHDWHTKA